MSSKTLNSDHLNYLIWRYLQESGYADAAVKLQRDWRLEPQGLPFAPHIKTHALVSLVQKGLQYHEVETALDKRGDFVTAAASNEGFFFFGPASGQPTTYSGESNAAAASVKDSLHHQLQFHQNDALAQFPSASLPSGAGPTSGRASPRKHRRDSHIPSSEMVVDALSQVQQQQEHGQYNQHHLPPPAPKRSRKSSNADHTADHKLTINNGNVTDAMDLDSHVHQSSLSTSIIPAATEFSQTNGIGSHHVTNFSAPGTNIDTGAEDSRSNTDRSSEAPAPVLTNGTSVGVQVDKVAEVGAETVRILDVGKARVLHAKWHPHESTLLATAGTAALARIWKIASLASLPSKSLAQSPTASSLKSPTNATNLTNGHNHEESRTPNPDIDVSTPSIDLCLHPEGVSPDAYVTSLAWSPDGGTIALAVRQPNEAREGHIAVLSKESGFIENIPTGLDSLICLKWSTRGTFLLGVSASITTRRSQLHIWSQATGSLDTMPIDSIVPDVDWISDDAFGIIAGPNLVQFRITAPRVAAFDHAPVPGAANGQDTPHVVRYDTRTSIFAVGTENGDVHLFRQNTLYHSFHLLSPVTLLAWHTIPATSPSSPVRLLAVATEDGSLRLHNSNPPFETLHTLLTPSLSSPLALAFSPDGFALAALLSEGAGIRLWNVEQPGLPRAEWRPEKLVTNGTTMTTGASGVKNEIVDEDTSVSAGPVQQIDASADADANAWDDYVALDWDADSRRVSVAQGRHVFIVRFGR